MWKPAVDIWNVAYLLGGNSLTIWLNDTDQPANKHHSQQLHQIICSNNNTKYYYVHNEQQTQYKEVTT